MSSLIILNCIGWPSLAAYYLTGAARRRRRENRPPDAFEARLRDAMSQDPPDTRETDAQTFLAAVKMTERLLS